MHADKLGDAAIARAPICDYLTTFHVLSGLYSVICSNRLLVPKSSTLMESSVCSVLGKVAENPDEY